MATRYDIETTPLSAPVGAIQSIPVDGASPIELPGILSQATYARVDADLLIELPGGSRFIIEGYFAATQPPALVGQNGDTVDPDVAAALAGTDLASPPDPASVAAPIGRIETLSGDVTVIRADGNHIEAEPGILIGRGDRIETSPDGSAGFLFADESTFSISENGRVTFDDLVFDPDTSAAGATFSVQQGTFSFAGGGISATDGAFIIKTPAVSIGVDGASGAGRVESDGGTTVTYLRHTDIDDGVLRVFNPGGADLLERSYETLSVEGFFTPPAGLFRLGPRDAAEHYGSAVSALPDAEAIMPDSLLQVRRGTDPATQAKRAEDEFSDTFEADLPGDLRGELQVDRDTAFEIAARKAAIASAARDAADEALSDAAAAEQAARAQAVQADDLADAAASDVADLRAQAEHILSEAAKRDAAFENAVRQTERAASQEDDAARDVAETDLAQAQAAERLAAAEEAVRRALEAAEQARNEALAILEEAKAKEEAFAAAQRAALDAQAEEEARALAVAEADAAEEAAAAALRAAEAAAEVARQDAEIAERIAQEASTAAEVVETVVERELAAIDPDLLKPPAPDDPAATRGEWMTSARASMDVNAASLAAGQAAAIQAYQDALANGASAQSAMEKAIVAAETYGGSASADIVTANGPAGLIDGGIEDGPIIAGSGGGGFVGPADTGSVGTDVLIGGEGGDTLGGGFTRRGVDQLFGYSFTFTPLVLSRGGRDRDERRDDEIVTIEETVSNAALTGTPVADFLVGDPGATTLASFGGDDFLYGDVPSNYIAGTHTIASPLTTPVFGTGGNDLISGGSGDDSLWGGAGDDTIYGDTPTDVSAFGFDLGSGVDGNDYISGGSGADTIYGEGGADTLHGDAGDDTFVMGDDDGANDSVFGGDATADAGTDTVDYSGAGAAVTIDLGAGSASGATVGTDTLSGIEHAIGSGFDDSITGSSVDNSLSGGDGLDTLYGLDGADNIFGYADDDILIGGVGNDTLSGGTGADTFQFEGGTGATTDDKVSSLGTDLIADYNASESDLFMLSNDDFALGAVGTLTDGMNYFEADSTTINSIAQDLSGGTANAGIVIIGGASDSAGAEVWYTSDASAVSDSNSYQIANVAGADRSSIDAGDFHLKA